VRGEPETASGPGAPSATKAPAWRRWSRGWRLGAALALLLGLVVGLTWVGRRVAAGVAARSLPTGRAEWIWIEHDRHIPMPVAFYAARDFELAEPPPRRARLLALADEEYILYLNGKRVGAGVYSERRSLDEYEVGALLRGGANRLVAELRSGRGSGGFLASLRDGTTGAQLVATDAKWRVSRRHRLGWVRGWGWLGLDGPDGEASEPALSWGLPPIGRWGKPAVESGAAARPLLAALTGGAPPRPAATAEPAVLAPPFENGSRELAVCFDFGRVVDGYLAIETGFEPGLDPDHVRPPVDRLQTGLLFTDGGRPPVPFAGTPGSALLMMPGAREWIDARPRRLRYALVLGLPRPLAARIYRLSGAGEGAGAMRRTGAPGVTGAWGAPGGVGRGVFGLTPPPLRTPVEDEVRRELQRFAGGAGRKKL
jgi:hypothetical protein